MKSIPEPKNPKSLIVCLAIIAAAGIAVYANSLHGGFIWDDERLIVENPVIKDKGRIVEIFTTTLRTPLAEATSAFRPLQIFSYSVDYSFGRLNVFGYHVTNVLFHTLAALALFWLIQQLFRDMLLSCLASLIFVIHPVHTEAVAYISGRADPMAALFMLASFSLYLKFCQRPSVPILGVMCLSYLGALLSRENALVLPALVGFYHFAFKQPVPKKVMAGLLVTIAMYLIWRGMVFHGLSLEQSNPTTFWQRLPGTFVAIANYIRLLVLPFGLHMEYGGILFYWNEPKIYIGLALLGGLLYWAFKRRDQHIIVFGLGWILITLLPVMNIVPLNSYMAEHWLYLPSMGYALIVASYIARWYRQANSRLWAILVCGVLGVYYAGMTVYQNGYWQDPVRFYERTLKYNPESTRLYTNLAGEFLKTGRHEDLIGMLNTALTIDPDNAVAYNNLGNAYKHAGKPQEAVNAFKKAIELNPRYAGPYYNLGVMYYDDMKSPENAVSYLEQAIAVDPAFPRAYHKLSRIYLDRGQTAAAIDLLTRAVRINPDDADIYHSLAYAYFHAGNIDQAVVNYSKTIELDPGHGEAYRNLAVIFYNRQDYSKAVQFCDKAAALGFDEPQLREALKPYR